MKRIFFFLLSFALLFTACNGGVTFRSKLDVDTGEVQFAQPQSGDTVAEIETSKGTIKVLLFPKYAPKAVQNFVSLAQSGYYDGVTFHRVVEDFIIQSGSPDGSANGGDSVWGVPFTDEFSDLLHNYTGALAMANSGRNTNRSQFYFVTTPVGEMSDETVAQMESAGWRSRVIESYKQAGGLPQLDYRYTVFGQIYEGLDVALSIGRVKTEGEKPKKDVTITSITITTIE